MNLFLTGDIKVGKSTVLNKALELLGDTPGGFATYFGDDRENEDKLLYMCPVSQERVYDEEHAVARFSAGTRPKALIERFNTLGVRLIDEAVQSGAKLIVMDECGYLERGAELFKARVLEALDGDIPVLGVVRLKEGTWTEAILNHPKVQLITVTVNNRDMLPEIIASMLAGIKMEITLDLKNYDPAGTVFKRTASKGLIRRGDDYLLVYSKYGDYGFPGGGMKEGETPQQTLIREVKEETGYIVKPETVHYFGIAHERRKSRTSEIVEMDVRYFCCEVEDVAGERSLVQYEQEYDYQAIWLPLETANERNKLVTDLSTCPWVIRDMKVMEYLLTGETL